MVQGQRQEWLLGAVLVLLVVTIWAQPAGSPLIEHDETRYAEIAREMLAGGDYIVPHLNGVPWYEKPPLLFWAGAASMRAFGATPWAARLPSRLAGIGTLVVLFLWVAGESDRRRALLAAVIAAGTPLAWGIAHFNVTDGLLTFFITSAVVVGYAAVRRSTAGSRISLALLAGFACGCAFLSKGLIGLVFPAAIVGIWAVSVRRARQYGIVVASALVSALAVVLPWLAVVARHDPEYLRILLVTEHFQRYTTTIHDREQPLFFMTAVFAAALMPILVGFAVALLKPRRRYSEAERLAVVWFAFVVLFFSFSKSQLPAYVVPAIPAASAFFALRFAASAPRLGAWIAQGALTTVLVVAAFLHPKTASVLLEPQFRSLVIVTAAAVLSASWLAVRLARKDEWHAIAAAFTGCVFAYAAMVAAWPRSAPAREMSVLRDTVDQFARGGESELVMYRSFMRGLPWLLRRPVAFVDPGGELARGVTSLHDNEGSLAWTEARFWQRWRSDPGVMAVVREGDIQEFERRAGWVPFIHARARQHLLLANVPPFGYPSRDPSTSTALYASELGGHSTPVMIASVPPRVLDSARHELQGRAIVRSWVERTARGSVYELAAGGPTPRLVEVDPDGRPVYTEVLFDERELPPHVRDELLRMAPHAAVVFVKQERPYDGGVDRYEILVAEGGAIREVEIDSTGRLAD